MAKEAERLPPVRTTARLGWSLHARRMHGTPVYRSWLKMAAVYAAPLDLAKGSNARCPGSLAAPAAAQNAAPARAPRRWK
jgi:hypothetical protein